MNTLLVELLVPDNKIRIFYNKGNRNNRLLHIRAIVDEDQIVTKRWLHHKKRWHYDVLDVTFFEILHEKGKLQKVED